MQRLTISNAETNTYRIPLERVELFKMEVIGLNTGFFGSMIDKLGQYEDLGLTPKELKEIIKRNK